MRGDAGHKGTVVIDCFPESAERYRDSHAIVAIDVIRATTTATTALALGRRVLPARSCDDALAAASGLIEPLLVGELGGNMPYGFDLTNSPAQIAERDDTHRPMVLVSSSGTQLVMTAVGSEAVYLACLRNYSAVARHLDGRHARIAVLGAGTRGQFRREDQLGCALVAKQLIDRGYIAENPSTQRYVDRWACSSIALSLDAVREGRSADYLRKSMQESDLAFVLEHLDDLGTVPRLIDSELVDAVAVERGQARLFAQANIE
jgi:2-phosphosulfolactate phosphatase